MTATPTPLRELARDIHHALCDDGLAPESPRDNNAMRETILRVLSARDEAGAVGSAYDGLCPCCGEIECEEPATPPASGEAVTIEATDLGAVMDYEIATAPAASGVDEAFAEAMKGRIYGDRETANARAWFVDGWNARLAAVAPAGMARLWDSQWVNVVNHDDCYAGYTTEEAVAKAVRLTEQYMRENMTQGFPPAPTPPATAGQE